MSSNFASSTIKTWLIPVISATSLTFSFPAHSDEPGWEEFTYGLPIAAVMSVLGTFVMKPRMEAFLAA